MLEEKYGNHELRSYEPVELTLPDFSVTGEEVDGEVARIASCHATNVTIGPRPIRIDDMVQINIRTTEDGHPFPGLSRDSVDIQLGVGTLPYEIEAALLGHGIGDVVEVDFEYTDRSGISSGLGRSADGGCGSECEEGESEVIDLHSSVTIRALRRLNVPEVTDEWVHDNIALSETVEEFRDRTREKLLSKKRRLYVSRVEYDVVSEMGKRLVEHAPEEAVRSVAKQLSKEFDIFLRQHELDRETYLAIQGMAESEFLEQIQKDAHDRVSQDIALASYASHLGIQLDDSDINAMFSQPTPERTYESRRRAEQTGEIDRIRDLAIRAKTAEVITRKAVFRTLDGGVDDSFSGEVEKRYAKLHAVRTHVTSEPLLGRAGLQRESQVASHR